jgi:hypothetical protein
MKIWKIALYVVVFAVFASCGSFKPAPSNTIKVLAVTAEGDTIQLDVNSLRPRVYQNIYHTYPYYYSYWNRNPYYSWNNYNYHVPVVRPYNRPSNSNSNSSQSGSGSNNSSPALVKPTVTPNKPATNNNQTKGNGSTGNRRIN